MEYTYSELGAGWLNGCGWVCSEGNRRWQVDGRREGGICGEGAEGGGMGGQWKSGGLTGKSNAEMRVNVSHSGYWTTGDKS